MSVSATSYQEIPAWTTSSTVIHTVLLSTAAAAIAIGVLAVLASQGVLKGPLGSLAAIGTPGGNVIIGCGLCGATAEIIAIASKRSIPLQIAVSGEKVQTLQREICCAPRFLHGKNDHRNPLWDTVENLSMMTPWMGAFHPISPDEDQLPHLQTQFKGMPQAALSILWCGHASFLIQTPTLTLLTDPNWEATIPFLGPIPGYYRSISPPCPLDQLPQPSQILLSHTHADHFNVPTLTHFKGTPICCPSNAQTLLEGFTQVKPLTWWEKIILTDGTEVTFLPSDHASQTTALNCNEFLWGGYKISLPLGNGQKYTIWFTGDSACNINPGIRNFDPRYAEFDKAIFTQIAAQFSEGIDLILFQTDPPIGQEDKHWNVWQGLDMLTRLFSPHFKANLQIIPMHWGTWSFSGFGGDLLRPLQILQKAYHEVNPAMHDRLKPMKVGETRVLIR